MLDLKYLTILDLDKFACNLKESISGLQKHLSTNPIDSDFKTNLLTEQQEELRQVESELLERTLLGKENEGGSTQ